MSAGSIERSLGKSEIRERTAGPGIGEGTLGSVEDCVAHPGSGEHGTQQR